LNYYLLAPEICLLCTAFVVVLADLFLQQKRILAAVGIVGLVVSMGLSLSLWGNGGETLFDGMLAVDEFALFFKLFFSVAAILVILASTDYVLRFPRFQGEYYALVLLSTLGMMLMAATRELISIYIALELTSISLYVLVGFLKDPKSTEAGLKYLLLGAVASAVLLYGMALVFGFSGQTHLEAIATSIEAQLVGRAWDNPGLLLGLILLVAGLGFKIAAVPFQMWAPDVYEGAPTPITAYLSVASKAAGFAVILNVFLIAFGTDLCFDWAMIFAVLSAISMTLGNVVAISQTNIKRMLAYSSIAHAGYLMIGLAAVTKATSVADFGPTGLIFFLLSYAVTNLGAFIAIIAISDKIDSDLIDDYSGMGRRAPLLALALTVCLVSLTGLPPTAGFLAKLYIFNAAVHHGLTWLMIVAVINTVISAYYYFRVAKTMWLGAPISEQGIPSSRPLRAGLSIACLGILVIFFMPGPFLNIAQTVVGALP